MFPTKSTTLEYKCFLAVAVNIIQVTCSLNTHYYQSINKQIIIYEIIHSEIVMQFL